jgi:seryl-tRNA synthetase
MRPGLPAGGFGTDEVVERLARLEEQVRQLASAVEKLANRDAELDSSLRMMSDRFSSSLAAQSEVLRTSLEESTKKFVSREDWLFWKSLLTAALLAIIAYAWNNITNQPHIKG